MITLAADCLLFELATGESIPFSADMACVELAGDTAELFDAEFVRHAARAVFHYFKHELGRQTVTAGDFAGALEKVLRGFAATAQRCPNPTPPRACWSPTCAGWPTNPARAASCSSFPRLRAELQRHLEQPPRVLRFRGLRGCVKQLTGARRWSRRCRTLEGEIVAYLRECLSAEPAPEEFALVVE